MQVVIYYSKYGHTRTYAEWIQEALQCDMIPANKIDIDQLKDYETIIFGHSVFAGRYKFGPKFSDIMKAYPNKNYVFFSVNLAATDTSEADRQQLTDKVETALGADNMKKIKLFFMRGGIDYSKLNLLHRLMMWILIGMLKSKKPHDQSEADKLMIEAYGDRLNFMSQDQINDLLAYVKGLRS